LALLENAVSAVTGCLRRTRRPIRISARGARIFRCLNGLLSCLLRSLTGGIESALILRAQVGATRERGGSQAGYNKVFFHSHVSPKNHITYAHIS
jgi:hypothetical protein